MLDAVEPTGAVRVGEAGGHAIAAICLDARLAAVVVHRQLTLRSLAEAIAAGVGDAIPGDLADLADIAGRPAGATAVDVGLVAVLQAVVTGRLLAGIALLLTIVGDTVPVVQAVAVDLAGRSADATAVDVGLLRILLAIRTQLAALAGSVITEEGDAVVIALPRIPRAPPMGSPSARPRASQAYCASLTAATVARPTSHVTRARPARPLRLSPLKLVERLLEASPRAGDTRRIAGLVRLGHLLHRRIEDLWELGEEPQPAPERVDLLLCHLCDGD